MKHKEILTYLCLRDPRNPDRLDFEGYDPEEVPEPRKACYCDNCFRGLDRLAVELLKYVGE